MMSSKIPGGYTILNLKTTKGQKIVVYLSGSPSPSSIEDFSRFMKEKRVTDVFCFCAPCYDIRPLIEENIIFHDMAFQDGHEPNKDIIIKFDEVFDQILEKASNDKDGTISVNMHCYSGLGRAPTMIAYLMMSRCGYNGIDCVDTIREQRKGSLNNKQLNWILKTKTKKQKKNMGCIIM